MIQIIPVHDVVFALVGLPLLGAAFALLAKALPAGRLPRVLEYSGALIGLVLPWLVLARTFPLVFSGQAVEGSVGGWNQVVGIMFRFDGLAWLVNLLGFTIAGAAWLYSLGAGPRGPGFTMVFLVQTAALAATSMTADLFNLFVCLEIMGIASYVLVATSDKPGAFLASFSYLMVSATAMIFFLLGIYGFYRLTGALSYIGIQESLAAMPDGGGVLAVVSLACIVGAVAIRVAIMPVYGWLPDSHALAPHAVSAVLSGVLIKTPLFALSRVLALIPLGVYVGQIMGYAGAATALLAVIVALSQKDAKRLLAYHTVSQIGYVVTAWGAAMYLGLNSPAGAVLMAAAFLHALYHAMFKGVLFLSIGAVTDAAGERNVYRLRNGLRVMKMAGDRLPVSFLAFVLGALAISAIPPMNGFVSKNILTYALKGRWEYTLLFAASIGTAASFIKLSRIFWPAKEKSSVPDTPLTSQTARISFPVRLSQGFLAIICLATGIAGPAIFRLLVRLFGSGVLAGNIAASAVSASTSTDVAGNIKIPEVWTLATLQTTALVVAGGILLFFLADTAAGKKVATIIRERYRDFNGLFLAYILGTLALVIWMLF